MRVFIFYTVVIGFACGIFLRSFLDIGFAEICFVLVLSFGLGLIWRRRSFASSTPYLLTGSVFLFFIALGILRFETASWSEVNPQYEYRLESEVGLEGIIVREPDIRESSTHLYVKTDDEKILVITDRFGSYQYGDVISVTGLFTKPSAFTTDLGRSFNYPDYLRGRGVNYMVRYGEVSVLNSGEGNAVLTSLLDFKHTFMQQIESLLPEPHVGLSEGLLLGVKRALGTELEKAFRETGIIHIVVLSGYNIMLVVAFVTFILGAFIPFRFQMPFGIVAIVLFALLVGLSATVVRASVMATLYLIARGMNRTYMVARALMLAGVVMLILNPYLLAFDTGFQLSFVATLGLILFAPHLDRYVLFIPKMLGREFLVATLATQIFVMPILLYQIGQFSVVSVLVNVLVLPMVPVAMLLTFLTGIISFFSTSLAGVVAFFTFFSLEYILVIATNFAALPFASYIVPAFPFWIVVVSYAVLGYVLWRLYMSVSDVGEGLVLDSEESILSGWVIVEEDVLRKQIASEPRSGSEAIETPVFFR